MKLHQLQFVKKGTVSAITLSVTFGAPCQGCGPPDAHGGAAIVLRCPPTFARSHRVYRGRSNTSTSVQECRREVCKHFQENLGASRSVITAFTRLMECQHTDFSQFHAKLRPLHFATRVCDSFLKTELRQPLLRCKCSRDCQGRAILQRVRLHLERHGERL